MSEGHRELDVKLNRARLEHADAVLELRRRAARAYAEMLGHEVRALLVDGLSPRLAEQAAKNNLGVRKAELDAELAEAVKREDDRLRSREKIT